MKTLKYRIIIRNIHPDGAAVHDIVRRELGKVEIVSWRKEGEVNFQGDYGSGPQRHVYVVVKYRQVPKKTKESKNGKKPAHEAVLEMVQEVIAVISSDDNPDVLSISARMGALSSYFEILKRMVIPDQHREEIIMSLRKIRQILSEDIRDKLFPESLFQAI